MSQLNLPHLSYKEVENRQTKKVKKRICSEVSVNSPGKREKERQRAKKENLREERRGERSGVSSKEDKKLSYRQGTARCVVSVKILPIDTQQCRNYLYDKS